MEQPVITQYMKKTVLLVEQNAWHEYIALQEIHEYVYSLKNEHDDRRWIYKTPIEWQEMFPFWSMEMIESVLLNLVRMGFLEVRHGRTGTNSKCFRIHYAKC
ncbi:hypothetical protein CSV61_02095 [Sporosarcina sp. P3]|uniref:hypothetical protein n=1 Tax=Sporosarcina sp. P3 TaxID=2048245 RepID=UPI000C16B83B|nr:hypothetical protein [Sporosarcina sp. P3]PID23260.1 hypothetical protein CSV61_02095 [Sporosarcina sp. P3]